MFIFFISVLIISAFLIKFSKKFDLATDKDFEKPQAIHSNIKPRILGLSILIIFPFYYFSDLLSFDFFIIILGAIFCSLPGLFDDFGVKINPLVRFLLQLILLIILFYFSNVFNALNNLNIIIYNISNPNFLFIFTIIAILTIANSFNFIDGCNGLVILFSFLVFLILYLTSNNLIFLNYINFILLYLSAILIFNFPNSKAFLGDFGAYFLGFLISLTFIYLFNNPINLGEGVNEWYYAVLLLYPSFEIFTTVVRRLINKKSPFYPDNKHLHSLIFIKLNIYLANKTANYVTTLIIILMNLLIFLFLLNINLNYHFIIYFIGFVFFILIRVFISSIR